VADGLTRRVRIQSREMKIQGRGVHGKIKRSSEQGMMIKGHIADLALKESVIMLGSLTCLLLML